MIDYYAAYLDWQKNAPSGLQVRLGIELGYQPQLIQRYSELTRKFPFDSVILSNHLFDGKDPYFFRECYDMDKNLLHEEYIVSLAEMTENCTFYDILGHFDYIVRYSNNKDPVMRYRDCPEAFDRLFRALISHEKSLEINTRTINKLRLAGVSTSESFPDSEALQRYRDLGGHRVTLGSDAHETSSLACLFDETADYLRKIGFDYNTTYINREEIHTFFDNSVYN